MVEFFPKVAIKSGARDIRWNDEPPVARTVALDSVRASPGTTVDVSSLARFILCARMAAEGIPESWKAAEERRGASLTRDAATESVRCT